jgi:hypothetical protein
LPLSRDSSRAMRARAALAGLALLCGCGDFSPYATSPLPADKDDHDAGPRVAICYDGLWTSQAHVQELAQQECDPKTVAQPIGVDWHIQACPLMLPQRANFVCAPEKSG